METSPSFTSDHITTPLEPDRAGVESAWDDFGEPVVKLEGHGDPRVRFHEADQRRREVQAPGADRRPLERIRQLAATLGKFVSAVLTRKNFFFASGIIGLGLES